MGVPKFYRWISERYPCLSEVVKEFQIPEFDNLYLDMNGIIHVCSHPDDNNPHFRITEEKIFSDIFHYLEFLFRMIKPRKVFYMAVDGVAPRAKMNQQRGRRFRSAREAEDLERKAKESGEVLPTEKRFDSNCITPGTEFMVKLQEQLKYFVVNKISNDPLWQGVDVYLSGHETPGEGEHKIMDFIRYEKSQPNYDPNTRHCLYGLDADLMMLGLATHEPHFSLLREEVKFGGSKSKNKRAATAEETTFHLLHLSLFREYLDFEFSSLKKTLPFPYNLERIIDDWILMGFLVGNDFIPHLPHLHIHHDALPTLWNVYMKVLPDCGGYLNDGGHLNLERLQKYFEELSKFDVEKFEDEYTDLKWLEGKTGGGTSSKKDSKKNNEKAGKNQFGALEEWNDEDDDVDNVNDSSPTKDVPHDGPSAVLKHFNISPEEMEDSGDTFDEEFCLHKQNYYMNKMEIEKITPEELKRQAEGYILGLQWILLYYFEGVPSWSWYFPFHYAPYISDVRDFKDFSISFDLGKPFLPFQQLMAVLPSASKELLPSCFQDLMTKDSSPIIRFYPSKFDTDLNGKQQDWEAVVLIPFIEEKLLLDTMQKVEHKMSSSESGRNCHGPSLCYSYTPENQGPYPSSLPGIYPDVVNNFAKLREIPRDQYRIPGSKMVKGLLKGCRLDVYYPGFPTLKHIKHKAFLKKEGVKVFQMNSRGENMMLEVFDNWQNDIEAVANEIIGQSVYVSWPHLYEAKVLSVSDGTDKYEIVENNSKGSKSSKSNLKIQLKKDEEKEREIWVRQAASIKERYHDRLGVNIGSTNMLISALPMVGRKYACGSHGLITLDKQFSSLPVTYCLQTSVKDITVHDSSFCQFKTIQELFPVDEVVFMLGWPHYGCQGEVVDIETNNNPKVRINVMIPNEPDIRSVQGQQQNYELYYYTGRSMAQYLGISPRTLSRLTGTVMVARGQKKVTKEKPNMGNCVNIGLNLKFTKRNEQVPGFTKLTEDGWMYTEKTQDCIEQYLQKYPEIWTFISKNEGQGDDIFYESEILPPESKTNLDKVKEFLKSLPCAKVSPQKVDASMVDEGVIQEIEKEVSSVRQVNLKKQKIKRVKMQVKPHLIYRPVPSLGNNIPDPSTTYELFDRVVNVRKGYCVPFGLRGTVIGINKGEKETDTSIEIVFDESFPGGTEIRCSAGKGYTLPIWSLINMTHGERKHDVQGVQKGKAAVAEQQRDTRNRGNMSQQYIDRNQSCAAGERQNNNFRPTRTAWQEDNAVIKHPWNGASHQPGNYRGQQVQNMRGVQIKSRDTTTAPTFVTPKVQCNTSQNTTDSFTSPQKKAPMESEFSNMWKDLKTNSPGNKSNKSLSLSLAAAKLDSVSVPNMPPSTQSKTSPAGANKDSDNSNLKPLENNENSPTKDVKRVTTKGMNVTVENLFAKAYSERTETVPSHEENASTDDSKLFEDTTAALKNMLRIGSQEEKTSESTSAPVYGRSLSVQELFDGAKKSCNKSEDVKPNDHPPAPTSKEQHRNVTSSQPRVPPPVILQMMQPGPPRFMNWFQRGPPPLQGFHGQLPQNQRNPVSDLNLWCHSMGLRPPKYEIKGNPGQYLCVVSLENGSRFQGSATKGKDEASESAAAVALLSLGPFHPAQGFPVNQMPRRNQNFPPGMPIFPQFSSPNSAFMPVSPRNTAPRGQIFQNYQNRYNHPPRGRPFHHQERFAQHPHNAYQPRASENQELRNSGPSKQDESPKQNPFVPLQVTKRRGTPRKSESETTVGDSHEMHGDENSKNRTTNASAKRNDTAGVVKPARNAEVLEKAETVLKPKTPPSHKPETQKHSGGKKKSRLAAKFNTVNNGT